MTAPKINRNRREATKRGTPGENFLPAIKKVVNLEGRSMYGRSKDKTQPPRPRKAARRKNPPPPTALKKVAHLEERSLYGRPKGKTKPPPPHKARPKERKFPTRLKKGGQFRGAVAV